MKFENRYYGIVFFNLDSKWTDMKIEEELIDINGYPKWVFDQVNEECKAPRNADYGNNVTANNESISTTHRLILPYEGEQGQKIIKSLNNYVT